MVTAAGHGSNVRRGTEMRDFTQDVVNCSRRSAAPEKTISVISQELSK